MKKYTSLTFVALPLMLAACSSGSVTETLGLTRQAPDEFTVVSRPPLSMPPEFTLRPPRPGEPPRGLPADEKARSLLTGKAPADTPSDASQLVAPTVDTAVTPVVQSDALSSAATNLLKRAGADKADANVRDQLQSDALAPAPVDEDEGLLEGWLGDGKKPEPTVDAKKEAERLKANKEAGKPVNEGDVPENKPKKPSFIDRIF